MIKLVYPLLPLTRDYDSSGVLLPVVSSCYMYKFKFVQLGVCKRREHTLLCCPSICGVCQRKIAMVKKSSGGGQLLFDND